MLRMSAHRAGRYELEPDEHFDQGHRCGGSVGFSPTSRLHRADQRVGWTLKNAIIVASRRTNVQYKKLA